MRMGLLALFVLVTIACGDARRLAVAKPALAATATTSAALAVVVHEAPDIAPVVEWQSPVTPTTPMRLTASDGSGLRLVAITGAVVVEDPLALTELRLVFDNPEPRRREGRFELELPPGATLSRLSMRVGDRWMEGEVVERARGQRTFESYIHRRPNVDPVLMERAGGNRVSARVFPIEPMARKEIIVSYSQALTDGPFRLPLAGLPELETLDVKVISRAGAATAGSSPGLASSPRVVEIVEHATAPEEDLVVTLEGAGAAAAVSAGELVVTRWRPPVRPAAAPLSAVTILFDTSASSAAGFDRELSRLGDVARALGDAPLRVVAFDQTVALIHDGAASEFGAEALAELNERHAFGASDLVGALRDPLVADAGHERLVVWGDGVATVGATGAGEIAKGAAALASRGVDRIDAVAGAGSADPSTLAALASAGRRVGVVVGTESTGAAIVDRLRSGGYDDVELQVEGAKWHWPRSLAGQVPGEDLVVAAIFEGDAPPQVRLVLSDPSIAPQIVVTRPGSRPLLARAVAQARIADLEAKADALDVTAADHAEALGRLKAGIVELSTRYRVLTDATAMLVLESEAEYRRFGIDRDARADIVTIGAGGIEPLPRGVGPTGRPLVAANHLDGHDGPSFGSGLALGNDDENLWGDGTGSSFGAGGLGLSGVGRGGGGVGEGTIGLGALGIIGRGHGSGSGSGSGYGLGASRGWDPAAGSGGGTSPARAKRVPRVRVATATVSGALDKDIVRRIVRAHINEVRFCYHAVLAKNPAAAGNVNIGFDVGPTGTVTAASLREGDSAVREAGECAAKAARRWRFPTPSGGGTVRVQFPFSFSPASPGLVAVAPVVARPRPPSKRRRTKLAPHEGNYAEVTRRLAGGEVDAALALAWSWASSEPHDVLALIALGEVLQAQGNSALAARVVGSIVDLYPTRADMRRAAGERLASIGALDLAIDTYGKAVELRPDHPSGHRLLAYALAERGRFAEAFAAIEVGRDQRYPSRRFAGVRRVLADDASLLAAAWLGHTDDADHGRVSTLVASAGVRPATRASVRLVATWETDATDVDLSVQGPARRRGHRLADVRTGLGPEAWVARGTRLPTSLSAVVHYYQRGPMGFALGTVESIRHDGHGGLSLQRRPFVLQQDRGAVALADFGVQDVAIASATGGRTRTRT
jgi:TonB family protein